MQRHLHRGRTSKKIKPYLQYTSARTGNYPENNVVCVIDNLLSICYYMYAVKCILYDIIKIMKGVFKDYG